MGWLPSIATEGSANTIRSGRVTRACKTQRNQSGYITPAFLGSRGREESQGLLSVVLVRGILAKIILGVFPEYYHSLCNGGPYPLLNAWKHACPGRSQC